MEQVKIADPGPLGLAGFGITTSILSLINAGVVSATSIGTVLALALVFGGAAQLLAGMWEFRKGNTFGATAFTSYGAFWISFYVIVQTHSQGVGLFLLFFGILTLFFLVATLYLNRMLFTLFATLAVTFLLLVLNQFGVLGSAAAGGWVGLLCGLLALYICAAGIINSAAGRVVLPLGKALLQPAS